MKESLNTELETEVDHASNTAPQSLEDRNENMLLSTAPEENESTEQEEYNAFKAKVDQQIAAILHKVSESTTDTLSGDNETRELIEQQLHRLHEYGTQYVAEHPVMLENYRELNIETIIQEASHYINTRNDQDLVTIISLQEVKALQESAKARRHDIIREINIINTQSLQSNEKWGHYIINQYVHRFEYEMITYFNRADDPLLMANNHNDIERILQDDYTFLLAQSNQYIESIIHPSGRRSVVNAYSIPPVDAPATDVDVPVGAHAEQEHHDKTDLQKTSKIFVPRTKLIRGDEEETLEEARERSIAESINFFKLAFFVSKTWSASQQNELLEELRQQIDEFIRNSENDPRTVDNIIIQEEMLGIAELLNRALENAHTIHTLFTERTKLITERKETTLSKVEQLPANQQVLLRKMLNMIEDHFITLDGQADVQALRSLYAADGNRYHELTEANDSAYIQFMDYSHEYSRFLNFVSKTHDITLAEAEFAYYFSSFVERYNPLADHRVVAPNIMTFTDGLRSLGSRLFGEELITNYLNWLGDGPMEENLVYIADRQAREQGRYDFASHENDEQSLYYHGPYNNVINPSIPAHYCIDEYMIDIMRRDMPASTVTFVSDYLGFFDAHHSLTPRGALSRLGSDPKALNEALLHYNDAYNSVASQLGDQRESQNYYASNAHLIASILSVNLEDPSVEFFRDYLLFLRGHQSLTPLVLNALSNDSNVLTTALLHYNDAYNSVVSQLGDQGRESQNDYANARLITSILSAELENTSVEFFRNHLLSNSAEFFGVTIAEPLETIVPNTDTGTTTYITSTPPLLRQNATDDWEMPDHTDDEWDILLAGGIAASFHSESAHPS